MTSDEKTSLDQIVAGDEVAYRPRGGFHGKILQRAKVERVTATWIVLNEYTKFHKKNGREVGKEFWKSDDIYALGAKVRHENYTYAELVEIEQAHKREQQRRQDLLDWIRQRLNAEGVTTEQLEQAAELLGYQAAID